MPEASSDSSLGTLGKKIMSSSPTPNSSSTEECFVIMPIADQDGYSKGHFQRVYADLIIPACTKAGFKAIRADDVKESNFIHLDILQKLLDCPMAVCDLSSSNPNVLFELALRQAFDKPVALIQELGTKQIFDIAPLRYTEYRKERVYHEVLEDQAKISTSIKDTAEAFRTGKGINSIVKLLALSQPAKLPDSTQENQQADIQRILLAEVGQLRAEFKSAVRSLQANVVSDDEAFLSRNRFRDMLSHHLQRIETLKDVVVSGEPQALPELEVLHMEARRLQREAMNSASTRKDRDFLMEVDMRLDMLQDFISQQMTKRVGRPGGDKRR